MATKTFKVSLSLDNPRIIQTGIKVRSFDKQSIKISIELIKDSQVYQIPTDAKIKISLLKLARQEQKIILDVPFTSADSIDWVVPDYLDGYQGEVRVGIYLIVGTENIDVGYFNITSSVSDIDSAAEEFTESVMQGWDQIEADLAEIRATITQVNTLASDFTTDVATKQVDVTSKYNAFDTSVTQASQTIDDILALQPQFQSVLDETTGKDVISAPELIAARNGKSNLKTRLDDEHAEVTAQLAQTKNQVYSKPLKKKRRPKVTFYLDDGYQNDYTVVYPKAKTLGIPMTVCLHNDGWLVENKNALDEMVNDGWEVHAHTIKDESLPLLSYEEIFSTMKENKELLENMGYDVKGVCYPRGHADAKTLKAARELFEVGMGSQSIGGPFNTPPIDTYDIKRVMAHQDTKEDIKGYIDEMVEEGEGWLVIYTHTYTFTTDWQAGQTALFELMDYASTKDVDIVTVGEAMESYGNQLDIGDIRYEDAYFKIGNDGSIDSSYLPIVTNDSDYEGINTRGGLEFEAGKMTIHRLMTASVSGIPFDAGLGTLFTNRLSHPRGHYGGNAFQIFQGGNGTVVSRVHRLGEWSSWVTLGGTNTIKTKQYTVDSPITDYPSGVITQVAFSGDNSFGNLGSSNGIGTLITSRVGTDGDVLNYQTFTPFNNNKIYKRYWAGSNWSDWEMHIPFVAEKDFGNIQYGSVPANDTKDVILEINAKSTDNFAVANFRGGLPPQIMSQVFVSSPTEVTVRLRNVSSGSVNVGYRYTNMRVS